MISTSSLSSSSRSLYLALQVTLTLPPCPGLSTNLELETKPPPGAGLTSVSGWILRWSAPTSTVQEREEGGRLGEEVQEAESSSS